MRKCSFGKCYKFSKRRRRSHKKRHSRKKPRSRSRKRSFGFKYLRNDQIIEKVMNDYPNNLTCDRA